MELKKQIIIGQNIALPHNAMTFLGPDLVLDNCIVESRCAAACLTLAGVRMNGGVFNAKKQLNNFRFTYAEFVNTKFVGKYSGCDFGIEIGIEACDFQKAILDNCRLFNTNMKNIVLPENGHISIEPHQSPLLSKKKPMLSPELRLFVEILESEQPAPLSSVIINIEMLAKRLRVTPEEIVGLCEL